jgi:hypothetical protein
MPHDDYSFPVACARCVGADEGNVFCPNCGGETATVPLALPAGLFAGVEKGGAGE